MIHHCLKLVNMIFDFFLNSCWSLRAEDTFWATGLVRKETIDMMKQDAIIINVARGEVVNNEDLADALNSGRIFAGLDVIAPEPPLQDHPIFNLNEVGKSRLSITPHIAGTTDDAFIRMSEWAYDNMKKVMNGERPKNIVNGL